MLGNMDLNISLVLQDLPHSSSSSISFLLKQGLHTLHGGDRGVRLEVADVCGCCHGYAWAKSTSSQAEEMASP